MCVNRWSGDSGQYRAISERQAELGKKVLIIPVFTTWKGDRS